MRRVVVTGMGIWSCIGQNLDEVIESLKNGRSGITTDQERLTYGLHTSLVGNVKRPDLKKLLARKFRTYLSEDGEYAYMSSREALSNANITEEYLLENPVGIVFGNDGAYSHIAKVHDIMKEEHNSLMVGPYSLFKSETSSVSMNLSTIFHLRGISLTVGAACASGSHAIGIATMLIRSGMQDVILTGGSVEMNMGGVVGIDAIEALSQRMDAPQQASRPFDRDRDGIVMSGGSASLVLEEYEHAKARGAMILAEIAGYGFSTNGLEEISRPDAKSELIAMQNALIDAGITADEVDYVNAHATSTPAGDAEEAKALTELFKGKKAFIGATKSMTGHENWMAGASEAVYSILMLNNNFIAPTINIENIDECAKELNIPRERIDMEFNIVLTNSSGMGGTNSALVIKKI